MSVWGKYLPGLECVCVWFSHIIDAAQVLIRFLSFQSGYFDCDDSDSMSDDFDMSCMDELEAANFMISDNLLYVDNNDECDDYDYNEAATAMAAAAAATTVDNSNCLYSSNHDSCGGSGGGFGIGDCNLLDDDQVQETNSSDNQPIVMNNEMQMVAWGESTSLIFLESFAMDARFSWLKPAIESLKVLPSGEQF